MRGESSVLSVFLLGSLLAVGCGQAKDESNSASGKTQSKDDSREPQDSGPPGTFSEIYSTLFVATTAARCNFCHSMPPSQVSNGLFSTGMTQQEAYTTLIAAKSSSDACGGKKEIVPGHPEKSLFFEKISRVPSCGNRMPVGAQDLSATQIEMIRSWIAAGANDD
jgi:hypothetical protein